MIKDPQALFATIVWTTAAACLPVVLPLAQWILGMKVLGDVANFFLTLTHLAVGIAVFCLVLWFSITYYDWRTRPPERQDPAMFKNPKALTAAILWTIPAAYMPCALTIALSHLGGFLREGMLGMLLGGVGFFLGIAGFLAVLGYSMFYYRRRTQPMAAGGI
ncbi:hypothetical protein KBB96_09520 [Luteolibacter ambystomatis]|uniref:Uncharacterized protein n=1 Tax=Luteolibacter ambystomatis TaxID=2824561 RepID=A0A975J338_9BACT|nr:hypothetical protein [Luteolibacter ambystomatis]QUE53118.1 hypothetical protein KBB96_09520 [Luteolibacter ambystomatis]